MTTAGIGALRVIDGEILDEAITITRRTSKVSVRPATS